MLFASDRPNLNEVPETDGSWKFRLFPLGSIKPSGWLKTQMQKDMDGFVGNLDKLVPELINDPIYGTERLHSKSKTKELGNLKSGDPEGEEHYKWWNSETQSNWWDAYIRNALLLDDKPSIEKAKTYIDRILFTQDKDGYLGIYDKELRYKFTSENGELWSKTTLYRGLLAWYEGTGDRIVLDALLKAVHNVMQNYPLNQSDPFNAGNGLSGGVAHGLTFTDVLDKMHQITGDQRYLDYAVFLYLNFSQNYSSEKDAQLNSILDKDYKLQSHGVHTYEHLRPLTVAAFVSGNEELVKALSIYISSIEKTTTLTGSPIGDEWIDGRNADATQTGYEYCSIHELTDSYSLLLRMTGNCQFAEKIENTFFNGAQGSRNPDHSCIAYLKTDNSFEMMGTKNGEIDPGRKQTRYKYSPVHQDVAVCCVPNAGRISPCFLQSCWLIEDNNILVAVVLCPNILQTTVKNIPLRIEEITNYPYDNRFHFKISGGEDMNIRLKVRKPEWAKTIKTKEKYSLENGFILFNRKFSRNDSLELEFSTDIRVREDLNHEKYFTYGALIYARPIAAREIPGIVYAPGFKDFNYIPMDLTLYGFSSNNNAVFRDGRISVRLINSKTKKKEMVELIPFGKTILRQVSFK